MAEAGRTGTTLPHGACTTGWAAPPDLCRSVEQSAAARPQDWGLAGNELKYNTASENVLVDVTGALLTSEAIAKLNLWVDGRFYKLTDIAEIQHGYSDPATKMFRVNGKPAIGIGVNMRSGGNNLTFGESSARGSRAPDAATTGWHRPQARVKAQIVGVGYILALNLILHFGDLLPTHARLGPLFFAAVWGVVILPIVQFGHVLYPSRTRAEKELRAKMSCGSEQRIYYVDPDTFADLRDFIQHALRSDWTSVLAAELLKISRVRIIKQARFRRGLMMTVVSFIVLGGEQFLRSLHHRLMRNAPQGRSAIVTAAGQGELGVPLSCGRVGWRGCGRVLTS